MDIVDPKPSRTEEHPRVDEASGCRDLIGYVSYLPDDNAGACSLDVGPGTSTVWVFYMGIVSMLLDNACSLAVRNAIGSIQTTVVTINLSVNFLAAARSGFVTATGRVTGGGKSVKFVDGELRDGTGRLLATCSAAFRVLGKS